MNLESLKNGFKAYMAEHETTKTAKQKDTLSVDTSESIFTNSSMFKDYISEEYEIAPELLAKSVNEIIKMDIVNGQIVEDLDAYDNALMDFEAEFTPSESVNDVPDGAKDGAEEIKEGEFSQADSLTEELSKDEFSMTELINKALRDDDVKTAIDVDNDGVLSDDEIQGFIQVAAGIDGNKNDISIEDILSVSDLIKSSDKSNASDKLSLEDEEGKDKIDADKLADAITQALADDIDNAEELSDKAEEDIAAAQQQTQSAAPAGSYGGSSGGVSSGGSSGGVSYAGGTSSTNTASATKNVDNMNEEELKKELSTKQTELSDKQTELSEATSGESSELKEIKEKGEKAFEDYQKALEECDEIDEELKEDFDAKKEEIDNKKQEISDKEGEITEAENNVSAAETEVSSLDSTISSIESAIASLESSASADVSDEQKSKIDERKSQLQSQLTAAQSAKKEAEGKLDEAKEALETAKTEKETLEGELETLEEEKAEIEKEMLDSVKDKDVKKELENLKSEYEDAEKEYDTAKAEAISKAQDACKVAQDEVNKIQEKLTEVQNNSIKAMGTLSSLNGKYTLNGKEYDCILDQDALDQLVQNAANGTAGTKYGHNDKCLSIAESYGLWAIGDSNRAYNDSGVWEYGDTTSYSVFNNDDKDTVMAEIKSELDAGRPCILHVSGSSDYSRHYVTVVGYSSSAGDKLDESDLLIWDSYDSSIRDCGPGSAGGRKMITGYATGRSGSDGYGYQIYKMKQ